MTATRTASSSSVVMAACFAVAAVGVWRWRAAVSRTQRVTIAGESWDRVKSEYPIMSDSSSEAQLTQEMVETVLHANPFSPQRRPVVSSSPEAGAHTGTATPAAPSAPKFVYKGRVNLGSRQRAVVEDATAGKTYFLEVGQEVAGFKVLDIGENRVVLSDLTTNKEVVVSLASSTPPSGDAGRH